jgi:lysophospholipase L1-like esterase
MDKILIFGDSISYGKWDSEGGWAARLRKYVDQKYNIGKKGNKQVYNLGIPGEVAERMVDRIECEMMPRLEDGKSTAVIFAIGVNDSCPNNWMSGRQTPRDEFKTALSRMIEIAKSHQCTVVCVGLTPVNPDLPGALSFSNEAVQQYDGYILEVCAEHNIDKLALFDDFMALSFPKLLVDRAHPNDEGHRMIAERVIAFLEERNML